MDLGGNVETCQRESFRTPIYCKGSSDHSEVWTRHEGKLAGRQATTRRGGGSGGGNTDGVRPPTSPGSVAPDKGVVQGCGQPCSAACLGYSQADHGGAGGAIQLRPALGDKHPHFCGTVPCIRLSTYGGQDRVGGETLTQSLLWGTFRDVGRTPKNVAGGSEEGGEGRDDGGDGDDGGQGDYRVYGINGAYGCGQLGDGGGPDTDGVLGGETGGGGHMAGGGPDSQGEEGLPEHWPRGDDTFYCPKIGQ